MDSGLPKRKRNRLKSYDYSTNGMYFITICTKDKEKILWDNDQYDGNIVGANCVRPLSDIKFSLYGITVKTEIEKIESIYNGIIKIENYVVMPNHIHLLILIDSYGRTQFAPTLSRVVKQFKGVITKQIGKSIFQRSFHDHIIRDAQDYQKIWEYIDTNPLKWELDCFYK